MGHSRQYKASRTRGARPTVTMSCSTLGSAPPWGQTTYRVAPINIAISVRIIRSDLESRRSDFATRSRLRVGTKQGELTPGIANDNDSLTGKFTYQIDTHRRQLARAMTGARPTNFTLKFRASAVGFAAMEAERTRMFGGPKGLSFRPGAIDRPSSPRFRDAFRFHHLLPSELDGSDRRWGRADARLNGAIISGWQQTAR